MTSLLNKTGYEVARVDTQGAGQYAQVDETDVAVPKLDRADVGNAEVRALRKCVLRQTEGVPLST